MLGCEGGKKRLWNRWPGNFSLYIDLDPGGMEPCRDCSYCMYFSEVETAMESTVCFVIHASLTETPRR